jgi:hypothetical protein
MHLAQQGSKRLHIGHLHQYVSAYETTPETIAQLVESLEEALKESQRDCKEIIVDQDGHDHFFVVSPSGTISLCVRWKEFHVAAPE